MDRDEEDARAADEPREGTLLSGSMIASAEVPPRLGANDRGKSSKHLYCWTCDTPFGREIGTRCDTVTSVLIQWSRLPFIVLDKQNKSLRTCLEQRVPTHDLDELFQALASLFDVQFVKLVRV